MRCLHPAAVKRVAARLLLLVAAAWLGSTAAAVLWRRRRNDDQLGGHSLWQMLAKAVPAAVLQQQQQQQQQPSTAHSLIFAQCLGAGGGRIAAMLRRLSRNRRLILAQPQRSLRRLGCPQQLLPRRLELLPQAAAEEVQLLLLLQPCSYNASQAAAIVQRPARIIGSVRQPLLQLRSLMQHLQLPSVLGMRSSSSSEADSAVAEFVLHASRYEAAYLRSPTLTARLCTRLNRSVARNPMATAVGYVQGENAEKFAERAVKEFDLLLVADHMDESLILLKRRMGWSFKEILLLPASSSSERRQQQPTQWSSQLQRLHEQFSPADYALFQAANSSLWHLVAGEGQSFAKELKVLRSLRRFVRRRCHKLLLRQSGNWGGEELTFLSNRWSPSFSIDRRDCEQLLMLGNTDDWLARAC